MLTRPHTEPPLAPAAYARSRHYSRQYVGRCIEKGIIHRAIVMVSGRRLLDPTIADEEMAENRPDATFGCWHEARGLSRPRRQPQGGKMAEDTAELIDTVLVPFVLDLSDRMAHSCALAMREEGLTGDQAVRHIEVLFCVFLKHLEMMLDRPGLKVELPDFMERLGDKQQRAEIVAALDARPPHPPDETEGRPPTRPKQRRTPRT